MHKNSNRKLEEEWQTSTSPLQYMKQSPHTMCLCVLGKKELKKQKKKTVPTARA